MMERVSPTGEDACVARARALAEQKGVKVLSLDVFDTLLWRVVPEPVDAFLLLGRALVEAGQLLVPAEAFARLREVAERRARARSRRVRATPEVSLEQVYEELPASVVGDASPAALADLELEFERSISFPDLAVIQLARDLQASMGIRLVLVSDTYFSAVQLRRLIDRKPFTDIHVEQVFTSADHGRNKGGGLYEFVLRDTAIAGAEVLHLGDDPDGDVRHPRALGIHAVVLTRRPDPLPTVLEREGTSRSPGVQRPRAPLHDGARDFGLTALRAKTLRRGEVANWSEGDRTSWSAGAAVFGPVFTGFAEWVQERAAEVGAREVFCVMREGAFLVPLLEEARRHRGGGAEARTLWLSRYACSQAAVITGSAEEIEAFLRRREPPTLAMACEGLGLDLARLGGLSEYADGRLDDGVLRRRFLDAVTDGGPLQAGIVEHCSKARRRLVQHVVSTVGRRSGRAVLVDLGWGATIQAGLDVALRAERVELETIGLYLLTNEASVDRVLDGVSAHGFLGTLGLPEDTIRWIMRSPEIIEQLCMPEIGSLQGFDDEGEPVTTPVRPEPGQTTERRALQNGVLAFQQEWAGYRDVVPAEHHALHDLARPLLRAALLRFVVDPTREEATTFGAWVHDENWGSDAAQTVLSGAAGERLDYLTPLALLELPMDRIYWPFGLAALHNPPLARAAAAVAFGQVPGDLFTAEETHATVYVDYGAGLLPRHQPRVRANSRGLYYLRQRVHAHPLRAVGVGFPPGPGLVRLDWMRMRFGLRGRSEPVIVDVRWPEDAARFRYHNAERLSDNLLFGARRAPRIAYDCPDEWGLDTYSVEVEVGFAWLASAPGPRPRRDRASVALALARRAYPRARKLVALAQTLAGRLRPPSPG